MRTISFIIAFLLLANIGYGQKRKVTTAYSFFTQGKLDKAKESIDEAMQHEDCIGFAKGYLVKGQIYQAIYEGPDSEIKQQTPNALDVAWDAYQEAIKLDEKNKLEKELRPQLQNLAVDFINQGVTSHNADEPAQALSNFKKVLAVHASPYGSQKIDTLVIHYAGIAAQKAGMYDEAIEFYKKSIELGYDDPGKTYSQIIFVLMNQSREAESAGNEALAKAKKEEGVKMLLEGNKKYPENEFILVELINYYLLGDNPGEAEQYLDQAIARNPGNAQLPQLYRAKATLYDKIGKPDEAEKMYLKTLELEPDDFISHYQLGNIHLDRIIIEQRNVNEIEDVKAYNAAYDKLMEKYEAVVPYFERALEIEPDNVNAITTLSRLYFQLRTRPGTGPEFQKKYDKMQELLNK